jgi:hypothetical protein
LNLELLRHDKDLYTTIHILGHDDIFF